MGRPMSEAERAIMRQIVNGPQGYYTTYLDQENKSQDLTNTLKVMYYGGNNIEEAEPIINSRIPSVMTGKVPESVPLAKDENDENGVNSSFFSCFNQRGVAAYLGILAEVELNNNIGLEDLVDVTSPKAKESKAKAKELLDKLLPKKLPKNSENDPDEWVFDYDEFASFVYRNTVTLQGKLYDYLKKHENSNLYDQALAFEKIYPVYNGVFDGFNQQFLSSSFMAKNDPNLDTYLKTMQKNQAICNYMYMTKHTVRAMGGVKFGENDTLPADLEIHKANYPFVSRLNIRNHITEVIDKNPNLSDKEMEYRNSVVTATSGALQRSAVGMEKVGLLDMLSEFERDMLAIDEDLLHKIIIKPRKVEEDPEMEGGQDTRGDTYLADMYYIDNDGNELPIQNFDEPANYNLETVAKMKYEINQVLLNERNRTILAEHGYPMDEIEKYQEYSPIQRVAQVQCDEVIRSLNSTLAGADNANATKEYSDVINAARDLADKFEKFVENPTESRRKLLNTFVDDTIAKCQIFVNGQHTQEQFKVADNIFVALNAYKDIAERITAPIKDLRANELQKPDNYNALAKVLEYAKPELEGNENLPFANGLEDYTIARPEGMSDDEYNAIVVGAFLSEDVRKVAKIPGAVGELAKEKNWDAIINRIMINRETEDVGEEVDIEEAFKLARTNANAAMEAYAKGDKSAAKQCVKDFMDATARMYDKDNLLARPANSEAAPKQMLGIAARVAAKEDYKGLSNLENTISVRNAIEEGVSSVVKAGNDAALKVIQGEVTNAERKEIVLDLLTKEYLNVHAKEENATRNRDISARLRAELAKNGVKLAPEINNADNFADMGVAVGHYDKLSRITDLEANFIGTNVVGKSAKDEFIEHIHAELEKTPVYRLLMSNNTALENVAIDGEKSDVLTGSLRSNLMNIKYLRTHRDIDNTVSEMEYDKQIQSILPIYAKAVEAKNTMVDIIKEEMKGRPELDYKLPLFAQYASCINASLAGRKEELVKLGYSEEKLDELSEKIRAYEASMKDIVGNKKDHESSIIKSGRKMLDSITEIEKLYTDLTKINVDMVDSPLDLIRAEKQLLTKCVTTITKEAVDQKQVGDGTFAKMITDSINAHNEAKIAKDYSNVVSRDHMRNDVNPTVANLVGVLKNAKSDKRYEAEYKTLIKGAQHLEAITKMLGKEDRPENLNKEGFEAYRDALIALTEKANAYLEKVGSSNSERVDAAMTAKDLVASVMPQVSQVDKIYDREASYKRRIEAINHQSNLENNYAEALDEAIAKGVNYDERYKAPYSNIMGFWGENRVTEGDSFVAKVSRQHMSDDNNYTVDESLGYTREEMALLACVMGYSAAARGLTFGVAMHTCSTSVADMFIPRLEGQGDHILGEIVDNIKSKMNQLQREMKAGNTENVKKQFVGGLRILLGETTFAVPYSGITNIGISYQYRLIKDIADMMERHPELAKMVKDSKIVKKDAKANENAVEQPEAAKTNEKVAKQPEAANANAAEPEIPNDGIEPHLADAIPIMKDFGTVMDRYSEAYTRVARFLQENRNNAQVTLNADSQIARDIEYVIAYRRLSEEAASERAKIYAPLEKAIEKIPSQEIKKAGEYHKAVFKIEKLIADIDAKNYSKKELVGYLKKTIANDEEAATERQKLVEEMEKLKAQAKEHEALGMNALRMLSIKHNMLPSVLKTNEQKFADNVNAEKERLFKGKPSKTISLRELAASALSYEDSVLSATLKSKVLADETEYRMPAILKYYDQVIDSIKALRATTAADPKVAAKIDKFTDEFDDLAKKMRALQGTKLDGSYINYPSEIDQGFERRIRNLDVLAKNIVEGNADSRTNDNIKTSLQHILPNLEKAISNDMEAVVKGELYGVTEPHSIDKQIDAIKVFGDDLKKSRVIFDGSSDEFKDLVNLITSLEEEKNHGKRNEAEIDKYIEKLGKVREGAKEYLRHKQLKNNGKAKSLRRIDNARKIVEHIDRIMPSIKEEARANSKVSRMNMMAEKMNYRKELTILHNRIFDRNQKKQAEIDKLTASPYKTISEKALAAREKLADLLLTGKILQEGYKTDTELQNQVKDCLATMILEKRIQLERSPKANRLGIDKTFTTKLKMATKDEEAVAEPLLPTGDESVIDEVDDINTTLNINAEYTKANHNENPIYNKLIKQVMDYNFISEKYMDPENIYKLLSDDKEVEKLYVEGLGKAMDTSQKERSKALDKSVAAGKLDKEDVKALNDDAGVQTIKNIKL